MIDTDALRGLIAQNGTSQRQLAISMGMAPKTFYEKMKRGVFDSDEIDFLIRELMIDNPVKIFFVEDVT